MTNAIKILKLDSPTLATGIVYTKESVTEQLEKNGDISYLGCYVNSNTHRDYSSVHLSDVIVAYQNVRIENNWLVGDIIDLKGLLQKSTFTKDYIVVSRMLVTHLPEGVRKVEKIIAFDIKMIN